MHNDIPTRKQIEEYEKMFKDALRSTIGSFVIIVKPSSNVRVAVKTRLALQQVIERIEWEFQSRLKLTIQVIPSKPMRALEKSLNFFSKPFAPQVIVNTFEEANELALSHIGLPYL